MAGELHDNAEQRAFTPAGAESSRLVVSNGDMASFQGVQQYGGVSVAEREQALFGNGFDFNEAGNIYGSKDTLAWDPKQAYGDARRGSLGRDVPVEKLWNPYHGDITARMSQIPEQAWSQAFAAFPHLKEAGLSEKQATQLMQAIMRNELYNFDQLDNADEVAIRRTGKPSPLHRNPDDATVGYSQISINGVKAREAEFPDQLDQFKGNELHALEDPKAAPLLIAATLAHNIKMYQNHRIPVTEQSLAYSYNPDVKDQGGHNKLLPTASDLNSSTHVKNVMHQLAIIRGTEKPKPGEL